MLFRSAEEYLANALIERRDKIGRYWLTRKSSFDNFSFEDGGLQFKHLASEYDLKRRPEFQGTWFLFDSNSGMATPTDGAESLPSGKLFLVEITSIEGKVKVYLRNRNDRLEVVGVER